jgi:hypothetical protein
VARRNCFVLFALAVGISVSGCAAANREEYSVMIRKPAHRYRPYTEAELKAMAIVHQGEAAPAPLPAGDRAARSELIRSGPQIGPLEPFAPFSYCYLHETDHAAESLLAVGLAPAEYPLAIGTTLTVQIVKAGIVAVDEFWKLVFPPLSPGEMPVRPPERSTDR